MSDYPSGESVSANKTGIVVLLLGLGMGYIGFFLPYSQAQDHVPFVSIHAAAMWICPIFLGFGVAHLAWGDESIRVLGTTKHPTQLGWIVMAILFGLGIFSHFAFECFLRGQGYR